MAVRLERALEGAQTGNRHRPVCIALVGGTGVGKSELFNALIGQSQASPSSQTRRPTTDRPYVAAAPQDRQFLAYFADMGAVFVDHGQVGTALMDTPDVDSAASEHLELARRLLFAADVVVYVASPDKRANFSILEEVRAWSAQKRWFFTLNKMDLVDVQDREAVIKDFALRLEEIGFPPEQRFLFAVSATKPEDDEFLRLRKTIFSARAVEQMHALQRHNLLNRLLHALAKDLVGPLEERLAVVISRENELTCRVRQVFAEALDDLPTAETIRQAVREQAWRLAPARVGGFLALPVWLRSRVAFSGLAYQLSRMASGGPSLFRMARAGWHAAKAAWRGVLPLQTLLRGFSAQQAEKLRAIALDGQRFLQDMGLASSVRGLVLPVVEAEKQREEAVPAWARHLLSILGVHGSGGKENGMGSEWNTGLFQERLENAVDACASVSVFQRIGWAQKFFGNLLPLLFFVQASYRVGSAWLSGAWLPLEFYFTALAVFLISLAPGYILVSLALSRRGNIPDVQALVASIERPPEVADLSRIRAILEDVVTETHSLRDQILSNLRVLNQELDPASFGVPLEQTRNPAPNFS